MSCVLCIEWLKHDVTGSHRISCHHPLICTPPGLLLFLSFAGFLYNKNAYFLIHPKLRTFKIRNVTHSRISRNPREPMFLFPISLFIVTFLSLISWFCHKSKPPKKSTHALGLHHESICVVSTKVEIFIVFCLKAKQE